MHASLRKELEARHSLLNLSVYNLSIYAVFKYLASSSNLFITIRCRASSLIYIKQAYLYADKYSKKHLKVCEADALKITAAYITLIRLELEAQLRKVSKEEELAKTKKEKREKEKNKVVIIDSINSILCNLSNLLVVRFYIFSNSALENIGILTNKKVTFTLKILEHVEIFALVYSFRKINRHIFRANNTISRRTIFNKFYNYKLESTIIAKFYKDL
ncbi:hypothetical protein HBI82_246090 [Parastagonospora nodorum]|nr:hypothetical protein HBI82_246090 [Parastagonospora nodorum]